MDKFIAYFWFLEELINNFELQKKIYFFYYFFWARLVLLIYWFYWTCVMEELWDIWVMLYVVVFKKSDCSYSIPVMGRDLAVLLMVKEMMFVVSIIW